MRKIKNGEFHLNHPGFLNVSLESKIFISKLISINPKKRMTADEALKSEWLSQKTKIEKIENSEQTIEIFEHLKDFKMSSKLNHLILRLYA